MVTVNQITPIPISELPAATTITGNEATAIVQGGATVQTPINQLPQGMTAGVIVYGNTGGSPFPNYRTLSAGTNVTISDGGAHGALTISASSNINTIAWGSITGTLSNQTDLQTALNAKLTASSNLSDVSSKSTSLNNLLPTQASHANQYLTTNGTDASWVALSASPVSGPGASTDNAIARWDGTAGINIQNSVATISDTGQLVTIGLGTPTSSGSTFTFQAYDVDGTSYTTFATLTAGNTPTMDLSTAVTQGGAVIYRVGGNDVLATDGGTGIGSYTQGDVLYASNSTTLTVLAKNASATRYLSNTGASNNPAWAQITLTNGVTGSLPIANGGTAGTTAATARSSLGLAIGTDVQAYDADLAALAANSTNGLWARTGAGTGAARTLTGTTAQITVADGDGVSANPTFSFPNSIQFGFGNTLNVSADFAFIGGGAANTITGGGGSSGMIAGESNSISKTDSFIGGGTNNAISGANVTAILGGQNNTISSSREGNAIIGGDINTISGTGSGVILGGENCTIGTGALFANACGVYAKADKYGQNVQGGVGSISLGTCQTSVLVSNNTTSNNTQTELYLDGASKRLSIASDTTWTFDILIVARRTDADNESAAYRIVGCIDNNAGTTALVGSVTVTTIAEDSAAWDVTAAADNTHDALIIQVTGESGKTIGWVARTTLVEVTG